MQASFDQSCTVLWGSSGIHKIMVLPSGTIFFQTPDLENFAMVYRSMERVINLARERWTLRAWQTGLSWQYFRASTLDCCSLSQSDTDSQAVSTARFRRAGQLATADTCYYSDYWNYEKWVNLQTTVKLGLWVISEILNRPTALKTRSSAKSEGPRDASCQLKSCQLPRNSAETTYTTSPDQIDGMKLEI